MFSEKPDLIIKNSSRSKSVRLQVRADRSILVTKPWWVSRWKVAKIVKEKEDWIERKLRERRISQKRREEERKEKPDLFRTDRAHYLQYKEAARAFITEKLEYWNQFYELRYNRVSIKNTKTRWGSCSSKGNVNFSYRLLFLPVDMCDYIVVHELCHLKELNHSRRFWHLVEKTIPHHKALRRRLRREDVSLE